MNQRLLIGLLAVALLLRISAPASAADLKFEAGVQGVHVIATGLMGIAEHISYDDVKGILVLKGTANVHASLVLKLGGESKQFRGQKITYNLKLGTLSIE